MNHNYKIRIYYEDTDAGGVVYYANYLKYMERARTEMLREIGFESSEVLMSKQGFVVADLSIKYKASAKLDDEITVQTGVLALKKARLVFKQDIYKGDTLLTESEVTLAYVDLTKGAVKIPGDLIDKLKDYKND